MGQHARTRSFYDRLADVLPLSTEFTFHHVSTPPTKSDPLFASAPGEKKQRTYCESHFLTISTHLSTEQGRRHVLVYAIEILIYTTKSLTTLFVAKADSTGFLQSTKADARPTVSPLRVITSIFISWLSECRQRTKVPLVVSLFARAQDQYLFPGSVENSTKHVLDDRQLIRWWCKTLDPVLRRSPILGVKEDGSSTDTKAQAFVIVPGHDKYETTSFFPPSWRSDPTDAPKWLYGHPLWEIAPNPAGPPRCLVPHFPDDPKARYLDELDDEIPDSATSSTLFSPSKRGRGMWTSIKTLDQFWETMAFRQECASGRLVGFIWVLFTPANANSQQSTGLSSHLTPEPGPEPMRASFSNKSRLTIKPSGSTQSKTRSQKKKLTGRIVPRMPKIKSTTSAEPLTSMSETSPYYRWTSEGRGQVIVDYPSYLRVHDLLLRLDFATQEAAIRSTYKWVDEVRVIAGVKGDWGKLIVGRSPIAAQQHNPTTLSNDKLSPNDLSGMIVRKKRKADQGATASQTSSSDPTPTPAVSMLNQGLIRKKPKTDT
ncbi:hypothetical protein AAFC00_000581 [Neodothiora populina]|uniref:histone acetyltransferase n=1 Tax=Neodothiora populina TaxID=2781224 RepID=A0ABR3PDD5_9PEZI